MARSGVCSRARMLDMPDLDDACLELSPGKQQENQQLQVGALTGDAAVAANLAAMFPALDPELINMLVEELPTPQHALETLLGFSNAAGEMEGANNVQSPIR
mmetsp:Transcript_15863/g.40946  ORF Transcript_15863/g.40946 Transcript_15863/m.40946 type:complete len:102 (+) Transcript_15863:97-402(+)